MVIIAAGEPSAAVTIAVWPRSTATPSPGCCNHDERISPWRNTGWGVVQAVNTETHDEQTVRCASRAERKMLRAVTRGADILDGSTLATLRTLLPA